MPAVIYDFGPEALPADFLAAVGRVVTAASQTENTVADLVGSLLNLEMIEAIALTAQMSASLKFQIARSVLELNAPTAAFVDDLDDLIDAAEAALNERNLIAHTEFCVHPEAHTIHLYRETARRVLKADFRQITAAEVNAMADRIHQAGLDVVSFMAARGMPRKIRQGPMREALVRTVTARAERRAASYGVPGAA